MNKLKQQNNKQRHTANATATHTALLAAFECVDSWGINNCVIGALIQIG